MTTSQVHCEPLSLSDAEIARTEVLLKVTWPKEAKFTQQYLDWLYRLNPVGPAIGANAFGQDGEMLGHYVVVPMIAQEPGGSGRKIRGALSLNTAVSPKARNLGVFTRLALHAFEQAKSCGLEFIMGVANQNSTHGFVKKLGFSLVGPLDAKICFGLPKRRDENLVKAGTLRRSWDEGAISWRLANPASSYFMAKSSSTVFYRWRHSINVAMCDVGPDAKSTLCKQSPLKQKRAFGPTLYLCRNSEIDFSSVTSFDIPAALKPSPLNLIYKPLTAEAARYTQVDIDAIDFDAF